jgi:hypothetical protein
MSSQDRRIQLNHGNSNIGPAAPESAKLGLVARWRMRNELEAHARRVMKIDNAAAEAAQAMERSASVYAYGTHVELQAIDAMGKTALEYGPDSLVSEVGDQIVERNVNRLDQTIARLTDHFSNNLTRTVDHA